MNCLFKAKRRPMVESARITIGYHTLLLLSNLYSISVWDLSPVKLRLGSL